MKTIISLASLAAIVFTMQSCRTPEIIESYDEELHQKNIGTLMKTTPKNIYEKNGDTDSTRVEIAKDPPVKDRQDW